MLYHYIATDKSGKITESDLDADSLGQVLQYLASRDLRPVAVKPVQEKIGGFRSFFGGIKLADKIFLTKYLSLMLKVGTDLLSAINILIADFDKPSVKNLLLEIRDNLTRGRPFYQAFERYPKAFNQVFVNLVKAAEASGNLQKTFDELSVSMQQEAELRNRVRSALVYPIILLITSFGVFMFLVTFALPKIAKVFNESGLNPPPFSRVVFAIGLFVNDYAIVISVGLLVVIIASVLFFWKTLIGRRIADRIASRLPMVNHIYRDLAIQRFAATFSALMKAGLPILETTRLTADVVSSEEFRFSLMRIADEGLSKGLTIGEAFKRETVFPRVVTNLIAISEKAGHLEEVLQTLSDFYASSVDSNIRILVSFLEPVLLLFMGVMVASIALSIIIPIYQLTTQF